jgi:hypothetical protein
LLLNVKQAVVLLLFYIWSEQTKAKHVHTL